MTPDDYERMLDAALRVWRRTTRAYLDMAKQSIGGATFDDAVVQEVHKNLDRALADFASVADQLLSEKFIRRK